MNEVRTIEVDAKTAEALESRAAELGVSVAELLAEIAKHVVADESEAEQVAELDRRWAEYQETGGIVHERVVEWLETWGTPAFRPWSQH